jgi:hypothetical protein|tara:strand:+ start:565 stop:771 length:207 start_codon:yes stop_codon:yes gene_type:complete
MLKVIFGYLPFIAISVSKIASPPKLIIINEMNNIVILISYLLFNNITIPDPIKLMPKRAREMIKKAIE